MICAPKFETSLEIFDYVYNWPSFRNFSHAVDKKSSSRKPQIIIFSLSKLTGYAASRVGWAFVADRNVAQAMDSYIFVNGQGAGVEAQYRAIRILQNLLKSDGSFFQFVRERLTKRWNRLRSVLDNQNMVSIDGVSNQLFAWLRCSDQLTSAACKDAFAREGLRVSNGDEFGSSSNESHVRIVMGQAESTFDLVIGRIQKAVSRW